jgi:hypothetical protein
MNRYVFKNDPYASNDNMMKRLGVIVITDFLSEYVKDYFAGNPLAYLS